MSQYVLLASVFGSADNNYLDQIARYQSSRETKSSKKLSTIRQLLKEGKPNMVIC